MPFTVDVALYENFAETGLLIQISNLPHIRHREQNFPPAQSRGTVTFSGLWFDDRSRIKDCMLCWVILQK